MLVIFGDEKSIKLRPSRLEQVVLPSVFHTEDHHLLRERRMDETMAVTKRSDPLLKMQDHHLVQLGVVLPQCAFFWRRKEYRKALMSSG